MKRCSFGFDCSAMFLQPGLTAEHCPNQFTCKELPNLDRSTETWFRRATEINGDRIIERIPLCSHQAARLMLLMRGNPQTPDSLGAIAALNELETTLLQLHNQLANYGNTTYIAPVDTEAHTYSVKRPRGTYQYNKLAAPTAMFEPSEKLEKVKVIHLSHDDDPRNFEAKAGIERRNKLLQLTAKLNAFKESITEVLAQLHNIDN